MSRWGLVVLALACSSSSSSQPGRADGPSEEVEPDAAVPDLARAHDLSAPADQAAPGDTVTIADAPAIEALGTASLDARAAARSMVYVGGFRAEIDVFRLDMGTAGLTRAGAVAGPPTMPSFFAWHPSGRFAYSVDE